MGAVPYKLRYLKIINRLLLRGVEVGVPRANEMRFGGTGTSVPIKIRSIVIVGANCVRLFLSDKHLLNDKARRDYAIKLQTT